MARVLLLYKGNQGSLRSGTREQFSKVRSPEAGVNGFLIVRSNLVAGDVGLCACLA